MNELGLNLTVLLGNTVGSIVGGIVGEYALSTGLDTVLLGVLLGKQLLLDTTLAVAKKAAKDSGGALQSEADALERDFGSYQSFHRNFQILASTQEALES